MMWAASYDMWRLLGGVRGVPGRAAPASADVVPKPRAMVKFPPRDRFSAAVCTRLQLVALAKVAVSEWAASSCVNPSLAAPAKPLDTWVNGVVASRALNTGVA